MVGAMTSPRAVAVVVEAGRVLVIKRYLRYERSADCAMCFGTDVRGPVCPGHRYAVLPGGHVEPGESWQDAAARELEEETTLTARVDRLLWTGTHNKRPASYYLMTDVRGTARMAGSELADSSPDNTYELGWASLEELSALALHPPDLASRLEALMADQ